jgi:monoterpene epsilon-lactone hydrolase
MHPYSAARSGLAIDGEPITVYRGPSLGMQCVKFLLRRRKKSLGAADLPRFNRSLATRSYPNPAPIPPSLRKRCKITEESINGLKTFTLQPCRSETRTHVIYTHGGAFINALRLEHWKMIEAIIKRTGASFTVPIYPLSPENDYRSTISGLDAVYDRAVASAPQADLVLMGDSAGGCLALGQAMRCRDRGVKAPARIVLIAPWVDLSVSNALAREYEPLDLLLGVDSLAICGRHWSGGEDPRHPALSPLFGDLANLPPIDVYQGTHDILLPDARILFKAVREIGGEIEMYEYEGSFHVFIAAVFTKEAGDALDRIAGSLERSLARWAGISSIPEVNS